MLGLGVWSFFAIISAIAPLLATIVSIYAMFIFYRVFFDLTRDSLVSTVASGIIAILTFFFISKSLIAIVVFTIVIGIVYYIYKLLSMRVSIENVKKFFEK